MTDTHDAGFRRLGEQVRHTGSVISLAVATFEAPDSTRFTRDIVHHPGAVSVVPLLDDDTVLMVRQYRAALDALLLEIPAGKRDVTDEPPESTAHRELEEEVGYRAGRLELLARFHNSAGFCDEFSYVYLARDLQETALDLQGIEEQHMTVERISLGAVPGMIERAELTDAKSIIGLTLAMRKLGR